MGRLVADGRTPSTTKPRADPPEATREALTTNIYDGFNRLSKLEFPATAIGSKTSNPSTAETYTYDANNNRLSLTKRDGTTVIGFAYDALNRITAKTFAATPSANVAYGYDLADRPTSALFANVTGTPGVTWSFDAAGRRITEATNGRTLSFTYDADSNPHGMTWPDGGAITYAFDAAERFSSVGAAGAATVSVTAYDALSRMTAISRGAASSTIGYDKADRLASLAHVFTPSTGNQTWAYAYSPASQIATATSANALYDWTPPPAATVNKAYDGLNRDATIVAIGTGGCAASGAGYDCNGNLTSDGTRVFTYDAENRLLSESGPVAMSLSYDPTGRLQQSVIAGTTTQFLYDGDALVAEYDGTNDLLRRYVHGPSADNPLIWFEGSAISSADANYLITDRQGSVVATANASGALTANLTYDAYGIPNSWGGSRFRYTGQIALPQAQLYYYKARIYDPVAGRFLQTDPVGTTDDLNLYAYVGGDPANKGDPSGEGCVQSHSCGGASESLGIDATSDNDETPGETVVLENPAQQSTSPQVSGGSKLLQIAQGGGIQPPPEEDEALRDDGKLADTLGEPAKGGEAEEMVDPASPAGKARQALRDEARKEIEEALKPKHSMGNPSRLIRIHPDSTYQSGSARDSYEYWSAKSTEEILQSFSRDAERPLNVGSGNRIFDGNTRVKVLEERGISQFEILMRAYK